MKLYNVTSSYDLDGSLYYTVTPYNLKGVITGHFKYYKGLITLIPFLCNCRLSMSRAMKLMHKLNKKESKKHNEKHNEKLKK